MKTGTHSSNSHKLLSNKVHHHTLEEANNSILRNDPSTFALAPTQYDQIPPHGTRLPRCLPHTVPRH